MSIPRSTNFGFGESEAVVLSSDAVDDFGVSTGRAVSGVNALLRGLHPDGTSEWGAVAVDAGGIKRYANNEVVLEC
jgi:hypothetical protein